MYARTRIAVFQSVSLAAALIALLAVIAASVTSLVREKDDRLYGERLAAVLGRMQGEQATLAKGGLDGIDAYVQGAQGALVAELAAAKAEGGGYLLVLDKEGRVVVHPSLAAGAGDLATSPTVKRMQAEAQAGSLDGELQGERVWITHARFAPWGWEVGYVVPLAVKHAAVRTLLLRLLGLSAVVLAAGVGITWLGSVRVGTTVRKVLAEVTRLRAAVDAGELSARGDAAGIEAEFRPIVEGFNSTMDAYERPIRVTAEYADRISRGDVPPPIAEHYRGDFNTIKDALNRCIEAVNRVVADAKRLAAAGVEGRLDVRADAARHEGEFRAIVQGVNDALDAFTAPVNAAAATLDRLARRDLCARVTGEFRGEYARLQQAINQTGDALGRALRQVSAAVGQVSAAASQIAGSSQNVAAGASEQAGALEEAGAQLGAMGSATQETARSARDADDLARAAADAAGQGQGAVEQMGAAMARIRSSAEGTAQIIKDINEIAFQTNLLALNAAVEAARAGDAGRGFAVVAEEVRTLAMRSKEAANKTESLISESVRQAEQGQATSRLVSDRLSEIASAVRRVTELVSLIVASAQRQATSAQEVEASVAKAGQVTHQNAANAEESSSAAEELSSQAEELAALVGAFQLDESSAVDEAGAQVELPDRSTEAARTAPRRAREVPAEGRS